MTFEGCGIELSIFRENMTTFETNVLLITMPSALMTIDGYLFRWYRLDNDRTRTYIPTSAFLDCTELLFVVFCGVEVPDVDGPRNSKKSASC